MTRSRLTVPRLAFLVVALFSTRGSGTQKPQERPGPTAPHAATDDVATSMNAVVDEGEIFMSSRMYRAIRAVEKYRDTVQKRDLTPAERNFDNFNISVKSRSPTAFLTAEEKATCYEVVLTARYLPGEKVMTDTSPKLGRSADYVVRKADLQVVRTQLEKGPW